MYALRTGAFVEIYWRDVVVGDILKIEEDEPLCADVVLFSSSSPEGISFIQTASLDGETNLKIRQGLAQTEHLKEAQMFDGFSASMECEAPNNRLYTFDGTLHVRSLPQKDPDLPPLGGMRVAHASTFRAVTSSRLSFRAQNLRWAK